MERKKPARIDTCICHRCCQLGMLFTFCILCSTWFAHIIVIRHQILTPTERHNAKINGNANSLNSKPHSAKHHIITLGKIIYADEKLQNDNKTYVINSFNRDYGQLSLPDNSSTFYVKYFSVSNTTYRVTSCNQECQRFRNSLLDWPKDKTKAAVYYLTQPGRLNSLNRSLTSLYHSFLYRFDYPVIVFHEADSHDLIQLMFHKYQNCLLYTSPSPRD